MSDIIVSVCVITYNHELFIKDAIDSILNQNFKYSLEVIISDDASVDNTGNIVLDFVQNHSKGNVIKFTQHDINLGMSSNFQWALRECSGKYIALCEGDDYWTDPLKLQRQVDFLESNPEYSMVSENSIWLDVNSNLGRPFSNKSERDVSLIELLEERQFATASVLFRNSKEFQNNVEKVCGDTVLWAFLSTLGKIRYKTEVTSVYRRHSMGIVISTNRLKWAKLMELWDKRIKEIDPSVPDSLFKMRALSNYQAAADFCLRNRKLYNYFVSMTYIFIRNPNTGLKLFKRDFIRVAVNFFKF